MNISSIMMLCLLAATMLVANQVGAGPAPQSPGNQLDEIQINTRIVGQSDMDVDKDQPPREVKIPIKVNITEALTVAVTDAPVVVNSTTRSYQSPSTVLYRAVLRDAEITTEKPADVKAKSGAYGVSAPISLAVSAIVSAGLCLVL